MNFVGKIIFVLDSFINPSFLKDKAPHSYSVTNRPSLSKYFGSLGLKLTKDQESLAWWYSKVSRDFWNLLVDIDKRNNKGEFDDVLSNNGNQTYYSNFYNREIYSLNQSDYLNLAKVVVTKNCEENEEK